MIKLKNISKTFNNVKAVDNVSLEIEKGEIICLIGPSGSGKSTVCRCIDGLETIDSGEIFVDGKLVDFNDEAMAKEVRAKMGFVFQHFNLFPHMTVLENMTLAPMQILNQSKEEAEKRALELLDRVGLKEKGCLS